MKPSVIITTSSWYTTLPDTHCRIGISRATPRGQPGGYRRYAALFPGAWFNSVPADEYVRRYQEEVLSRLDPQKTIDELVALASGRIPALLCFEAPEPGDDFCHRALVSCWLHETLGLEVLEFGQEHHGFGASHPKLPPHTRRPMRVSVQS
ncbi:MAG: DUF488 family protein [Hyphomicrobiaceae bacterium]|nr:DUF488 family protein [Hyphomicrobiaceae bacterium]